MDGMGEAAGFFEDEEAGQEIPKVIRARFAEGRADGEDEGEVGSDRRGVGPEALFYAAVEQLVTDAKRLRELGVIVGIGRVREWPRDARGRNRVFLNDYDRPEQVDSLLEWLTCGGIDRELAMLGSDIDPNRVLKQLGLVRRSRRATA